MRTVWCPNTRTTASATGHTTVVVVVVVAAVVVGGARLVVGGRRKALMAPRHVAAVAARRGVLLLFGVLRALTRAQFGGGWRHSGRTGRHGVSIGVFRRRHCIDERRRGSGRHRRCRRVHHRATAHRLLVTGRRFAFEQFFVFGIVIVVHSGRAAPVDNNGGHVLVRDGVGRV